MIRSLYTAATGMVAQQLDQDVVANNLANVNSPGFKKSRADFQDLMYQITAKSGAETSGGNQIPAGIEIGMGVKPVATQKIFTQGDYQQTGNTFDWAIEGDGFFQFDDNGKTLYSRAGNLKINKDGAVCNSEGLKLIPNITVPANATVFTIVYLPQNDVATVTCQPVFEYGWTCTTVRSAFVERERMLG